MQRYQYCILCIVLGVPLKFQPLQHFLFGLHDAVQHEYKAIAYITFGKALSISSCDGKDLLFRRKVLETRPL